MAAAWQIARHPMTTETSAQAKRQKAAHARRLAATLLLDHDRDRLLHYAVELEQQAEALERQAAARATDRTSSIEKDVVQQQKQQQQQGVASTDDGPTAGRPTPKREN